MKVNRQQLLLGALLAIGAVRAGDWVLTAAVQGPLDERRARTSQLEEEVEKLERVLAQGRRAGQKIQTWQEQSLPADTEVARTLYRSWLLERIEAAKLQSATVDSGSPTSRGGSARALPFTMRARGTLDQITRFLFDFSQAAQLHRIQSLDLNPVGGNGQFDIALGIEALTVPGTKRTTLNDSVTNTSLASANLTDYQVISRRNIFGVGSQLMDPLRNTFVTAITKSNGEPQVWFTLRVSDEVRKLRQGDVLAVEDFEGTIAEILPRDVVIDSHGERWLLSVGENLADRFAVPPTP
ncbi:MAG: hypothetical protein KF861_13150 [Planctomycetaceae bacterium]|nr:hypothetical protein [Planctomycetaceae bacterium]